ncbi:MAG: prenyltransferase/squalene oxidase repeat-containing protein [Planctomycetota bacterium]
MLPRHRFVSVAMALIASSVALSFASARAADPEAIKASIAKASKYLIEQGQAQDGSFSAQAGPAVTALAVTALVQSGTPADAPAVQKAIAYLLEFRNADGGIHPPESPVANYETSIAMLALAACNKDGRYDKEIKGAEAFVKGLQWDDGEGPGPSDPAYGGAGYGKKNRPDLSNTSFLIDALRSVGTAADDPAIQRALVFVSRTQNLEGPNNTLPFPAKNPDGGFYYTPAAGGESQAGKTPGGGLRSYGSMTYAGLKSMIFAGLKPDDPRVKAALSWLAKHYTFAENPGLGDAGLYYYFHTAARALDVLGAESFADAAGKQHAWRNELSDAILARQLPDGSWVNANPRWMEGDPNLVTSYTLLALSYCTK